MYEPAGTNIVNPLSRLQVKYAVRRGGDQIDAIGENSVNKDMMVLVSSQARQDPDLFAVFIVSTNTLLTMLNDVSLRGLLQMRLNSLLCELVYKPVTGRRAQMDHIHISGTSCVSMVEFYCVEIALLYL